MRATHLAATQSAGPGVIGGTRVPPALAATGGFVWFPPVCAALMALWFGRVLPPWAYMWLCAAAIFLGFKWLTFWRVGGVLRAHPARCSAYFLFWPGMDADAFLFGAPTTKPSRRQFIWPAAKISIGAAMLWGGARMIPAGWQICRGWFGLFALILLLHFGSFELSALLWQARGVNAAAIMQKPLASKSLSEFWGKRWNLGFRQIAHEFIFQPVRNVVGAPAAMMAVFLFSGLLHELVISVPARGGYGLPTAYFLLQGIGVSLERTRIGRRIGLRGGFTGWAFAAGVTAIPAYWLFHPQFIRHVILPFMEVIHAL